MPQKTTAASSLLNALLILFLFSPVSAPFLHNAKALGALSPKGSIGNKKSSLAQTGQRRSDRVVGGWKSSTGAELILALSGNANTLWVQVYLNPGRAQPRIDYTARWTGDNRFSYTDSSGSVVVGKVHPSGQAISLQGSKGWTAEWSRMR